MKDIYDIVQDEIFDNLNKSVKILTVSNVTTVFTITLCDNKWIRVGQDLTDLGGKLWRITEIDIDGVITCTKPTGATNLVKYQVLTIKQPIFIFGTRINANNDYLKLGRDSRLKLPLIWLVESVSEEEYGVKSNLERKSSIRVLFLDDNNPKQYQTNDYRLNVVSPMIGLKNAFIKAVLDNRLFNELDSWNTRPFTRLGTESEKGFEANILDENLSGVELSITLPIRKVNCNC